MDKRKYNKGTPGNKGGRKPKSEEQKLLEEIGPMKDLAHAKLERAMEQGEPWAVKLWFEYYYGKPKQSMDISGDLGQTIVINEITKK